MISFLFRKVCLKLKANLTHVKYEKNLQTFEALFLFQVAVKIIDMNNIKDDYVRRNLFREARLLRKLAHPNIIKLFETIKVRLRALVLVVIFI